MLQGLEKQAVKVRKVPRGGYNSVDLMYRMSDGVLVKMILEEAIGVINTYQM